MWIVAETTWMQPEGGPRYHCHRLAGMWSAGEVLPRVGTLLRFELPDGRVLLARTRSATVWHDQAALCVDGSAAQAVGAGARVRIETTAPLDKAP